MDERERDREAIRGVVEAVGTAFDAGRADDLVALFDDDGWAVSADGTYVRGREALRSAYRALFSGPAAGQSARHRVADVVLLGADGAAARVLVTATDAAGNDVDVGHTMTTLLVLARRDDRWRIAARQDTLVPSTG